MEGKILKIYISHASKFDYINKLYNPLKESILFKDHVFILPHDEEKVINTKAIISSSDLLIAETSIQTTGQGIELGWADYAHVPIKCIYEKGAEISSALKFISNDLIEYENPKDMIQKIEDIISKRN